MAKFPSPVEGMVIRYDYLWREEFLQGAEEGSKSRPCAIVLVVKHDDKSHPIVTVLPVTHSPPRSPDSAFELPPLTKQRLGLDDQRSWVVITEANQFRWPGPDLRRIEHGDNSSIAYGFLPEALYERIRLAFAAAIRRSPKQLVIRTE